MHSRYVTNHLHIQLYFATQSYILSNYVEWPQVFNCLCTLQRDGMGRELAPASFGRDFIDDAVLSTSNKYQQLELTVAKQPLPGQAVRMPLQASITVHITPGPLPRHTLIQI
jgi:hypothetical protein